MLSVSLFDLIDNFFEFFHRGIGVVLELSESAGVVIGDCFRQVATGQGVKYAHHFIEAGFAGFHKLIETFAQLLEESLPCPAV